MNYDLSIIIPCYNHGIYLQDAIDSIIKISTHYSFEIIIINDGSNDSFTLQKLAELQSAGLIVINQSNKGLAAARNNGINLAKGKYIIPLDSDNKLHQNYLTSAIDILESNTNISIVFGNRYMFGEEERMIAPGEFKLPKLINSNYIDACAVYRKSIWQSVGGYDGNMPAMGHEDWDFWITIALSGGKFYYLNKLCFYYRVTNHSMRLNISNPNFEANKEYIIKKNSHFFYLFYKSNWKKIEYMKSHQIKAGINLIFGKLGV